MGKKKIRKGKKKVTERETKRQITEQKKKRQRCRYTPKPISY